MKKLSTMVTLFNFERYLIHDPRCIAFARFDNKKTGPGFLTEFDVFGDIFTTKITLKLNYGIICVDSYTDIHVTSASMAKATALLNEENLKMKIGTLGITATGNIYCQMETMMGHAAAVKGSTLKHMLDMNFSHLGYVMCNLKTTLEQDTPVHALSETDDDQSLDISPEPSLPDAEASRQ